MTVFDSAEHFIKLENTNSALIAAELKLEAQSKYLESINAPKTRLVHRSKEVDKPLTLETCI